MLGFDKKNQGRRSLFRWGGFAQKRPDCYKVVSAQSLTVSYTFENRRDRVKLAFKVSKPDARVLILQIILASYLSFSFNNWIAMFLLFAAIDVLVLVRRGWRHCIRFLCIYTSLLALTWCLTLLGLSLILSIFQLFFLLVIRVYPIYMLAGILLAVTPMNELLAALEKMHVPKALLIPLMVIYRYIPTLIREIGYVRESHKMRGSSASLPGILRHPVKEAEDFLVPLLYRSEKISEELAAAAICKGLSVKRKRSCCTDVRLGWRDICYVAGMTAVAAALIYINAFGPVF